MATTGISIVIPAVGRDVHSAASALGAARPRDELRASPIDAVRLAESRPGFTRATASSNDRWQQPQRETWAGVVHGEPQGTTPFLVQQLAQEGFSSPHDDQEEPPAVPSVRFAAQQAYAASRDSTVEFLSPTPSFDIRV